MVPAQATLERLKTTPLWALAKPTAEAARARRSAPAPAPATARPPSPPRASADLANSKALYADFKKKEMKRLRKERPGKSPADLRDEVFLNWQRSPENPKNAAKAPEPAKAAPEEPAVEWVGD